MQAHDPDAWLTAMALDERTDPPHAPTEADHETIRAIRHAGECLRGALATEPLPESPDMYERIRSIRSRDRRRTAAMILLPAAGLAAVLAIGATVLLTSEGDAPAPPVVVDPNIKPEPGVVMIGRHSGHRLEELPLELPNPVFAGTPKEIPDNVRIDMKRFGRPRVKVLAPAGLKNIAIDKEVTSSDDFPIIGDLEMATDGDKEALDGRFVELAPGKQWLQIDLGKPHPVFAVAMWHNHLDARVYRDVVVQLSNDPQFKEGVTTIFNNDHDNSSGFGVGNDFEYFENYEGEVVGLDRGVTARYVRCWSKGSTADDANQYSEVEVWGYENFTVVH